MLNELSEAIDEYFRDSNAELVPPEELSKPVQEVLYLPMHIVYKDASTTTKSRVVLTPLLSLLQVCH